MELPNRKQRRLWAKETGMLKKKQNASEAEKAEIRARALEAGKKIHNRNVERNLEQQEKQKEERQKKLDDAFVAQLLEKGHSQEEALKLLLERNGLTE